jgi:hypothetical protein
VDDKSDELEALCRLERYVRCTPVIYVLFNSLFLSYYTHPDTPRVDYPDGFQGTSIPVYGPAVAKLIEGRLDGTIV